MERRILLAVRTLGSLLGLYGRRNEKLRTVGVVDEEDWAIVLWVNVFFHGICMSGEYTRKVEKWQTQATKRLKMG